MSPRTSLALSVVFHSIKSPSFAVSVFWQNQSPAALLVTEAGRPLLLVARVVLRLESAAPAAVRSHCCQGQEVTVETSRALRVPPTFPTPSPVSQLVPLRVSPVVSQLVPVLSLRSGVRGSSLGLLHPPPLPSSLSSTSSFSVALCRLKFLQLQQHLVGEPIL